MTDDKQQAQGFDSELAQEQHEADLTVWLEWAAQQRGSVLKFSRGAVSTSVTLVKTQVTYPPTKVYTK